MFRSLPNEDGVKSFKKAGNDKSKTVVGKIREVSILQTGVNLLPA